MNHKIDQILAQQIVNTVKDVCGCHINFINCSGIILASTNEKRIGTFHEIGLQAANSKTPIEVEQNDRFTGTKMGVNVPIYHNQSVVAVIGISGIPNEVKQFAYLAQKITNLLIREQELNAFSRTQAEKKHSILYSLIHRKPIHFEYLAESLERFGISMNGSYQMILIQIHSRYNLMNLGMIEQQIKQLFKTLPTSLSTYTYPNEYLSVILEEQIKQYLPTIEKFSMTYPEILKISIGKPTGILDLSDSYESCLTALKSIHDSNEAFVLFDHLTLELILSRIDRQQKDEFLQKVLLPLSDEDLQLIHVYFDEDCSLKRTGERLFLHANSLQYKLDRISRKCGYNPRNFKDAVILYLALKLQ